VAAYFDHVLQVRRKRLIILRITQLETTDDFVKHSRRNYEVHFVFYEIGVNVR